VLGVERRYESKRLPRMVEELASLIEDAELIEGLRFDFNRREHREESVDEAIQGPSQELELARDPNARRKEWGRWER
jgi:hypothetical protein